MFLTLISDSTAPYSFEAAEAASVLGDPGTAQRDSQMLLNNMFQSLDLSEPEFKTLFEKFILTFQLVADKNAPSTATATEWDDDIFESVVDSENATTSQTTRSPHYLHLLRRTVESAGADATDRFGAEHQEGAAQLVTMGHLLLDLHHLHSGAPDVFSAVLQRPADCIVFMDEVLTDLARREYADMGLQNISIKVGPTRAKSFFSYSTLFSSTPFFVSTPLPVASALIHLA